MIRSIVPLLFVVVACGDTSPKPSEPAATPKPMNAVEPPRLPEPQPSNDAIPTHPDVSPRISCDADVDIQCPDGYEDGCAGGRTTYTVCVRKGLEARVPCDREIVHRCPAGEINACAAQPPYGEMHICVKQ